MKIINIKNGDRFNRLLIVKEIERGKYNKIRYVCHCDCGNDFIADNVEVSTDAYMKLMEIHKEFAST